MKEIETGELLKFEKPGTKLKGILTNYERKSTPKGEGHVYEVTTPDGVIPFFASMLLHKKLKSVPIGNCVSIVYEKETKTNTGNPLKHYKVLFGEQNAENLKAIGMEGYQSMNEVDVEEDEAVKKF